MLELKAYPVQRGQRVYFSEEETEARGGGGTSPTPGNPFVAWRRPLSGTYPMPLAHWDLSLVSLCCLGVRSGQSQPPLGHAMPSALSLFLWIPQVSAKENKPFGGEEEGRGEEGCRRQGTVLGPVGVRPPSSPPPAPPPPAMRGCFWCSNDSLSLQKG